MFAVGDKVQYRGRGVLPRHNALAVKRIINGFVYLEGYKARYKNDSFIKFNAEIPIPVKEDLLAELTRKANKAMGTCSYALEFEDGYRRFQVSDVCHARMPFGGYSDNHKNNLVLKAVALNISNHIKRGNITEEGRRNMIRMYEYIIFRSPWKDAFIKPADNKVPVDSGVYVNINMPFSYCVAGAIALRSVSEFPYMREMFIRMVDLGIDEHIAFIASTCASNGGDEYGVTLRRFDGGHHVVNITSHKAEDLRSFFYKNKLTYVDKSYKDSINKMYKIWEVIGPARYAAASNLFERMCDDLPKEALINEMLWGQKYQKVLAKEDKTIVKFCNNLMKEMLK